MTDYECRPIFRYKKYPPKTFGRVLYKPNHKYFFPKISVNGIPKCSLSSPKQELNDCLKEVFAYLTPRLKDGVPELQIPAMDPLTIDKAKYQLKRNDFQLRVVVKNVMITGLVGSITKDVDFHLDGDKIFLKTNSFVARVNTTGLYKAEMVFSNTPRYYEGTFDVAIMDLDCLNEFEGEIMEKCYCGCQECECDCSSEKAEKKKVVQLVKYNVVPTVGNMNIKATGLNPDPAISEYRV